MRIISEPMDLTCAGSAHGIDAADRAGAKVINMSYGGRFCFAEYLATSYAFGDGALPVASGGNDFDVGNRIAYPASDPHVLTVAATDPNDKSAFFSSENAGIDMSAPGVDILVAVPPALDDDGTPDGYQVDSGTSFSAPIVSAAAAWLEAARPGYQPDQYVDLLRYNSDDLGKPGWDQAFGFGRLDLARALTARVGPEDGDEPNDDIYWVNGTLYDHPDTPIFGRHSHSGAASGYIDEWEDPADVYRVWLPAHSRLRITLTPYGGDPELGVWSTHAKTIYSRRGLVALSNRRGKRVETIIVHNTRRHATVDYVAAGNSPRSRGLNAGYLIRVRKLRGH
jgi:hypothetical protein